MGRSDISKIGRKSAASAAADALRAAILDGGLHMGQPLSENALVESLGVSRTPLRAALLELEGEGLVELVPYKGAHVFSLTEAQIIQLGSFRKTLELTALDAAISSGAGELVEAIEVIVEELSAAALSGDSVLFGRLDTKLHECIIFNSGNEYLIQAYHPIALKLAVLRMLVTRSEVTIKSSNHHHLELLSHLRNGNFGEARALLARHIDGATSFYAENTRHALDLRLVKT